MAQIDSVALRNEILDLVMSKIYGLGAPALAEAAVACAGAMAVCIAALPPEHRESVMDEILAELPRLIEKRATEIRSGVFDRMLDS